PAGRPARGEPAPERAPRGHGSRPSRRLGRERLRERHHRVRGRPLAPVREERLQARAHGDVAAAMAGLRGLTSIARMAGALPEMETARLAVRLARPGMESAMARFLQENFEGHLDRWSPPCTPSFFTASFWRERLAIAVEEYHAGRSARFVMQDKGPPDGPILGTCNYTNIVRGPFQACHLGYQIARARQGQGLMTEALRATNAFAFAELRLHRIMANYRP